MPDRQANTPRPVHALAAEPPKRPNPLLARPSGLLGLVVLTTMVVACLGSLPWTMGSPDGASTPRYNAGTPAAGRLPPSWVRHDEVHAQRLNALVPDETVERIAAQQGRTPEEVRTIADGRTNAAMRDAWPSWLLGTDKLGRSLLVRSLTGGGISLTIGIAAAVISVAIGTLYGVIAGFAGGRLDAIMMRIVDVLFGLPYILLVVLLAVAGDAMLDEYISQSKAKEAFVREQAAALIESDAGDADASRTDVTAWLARYPERAAQLRDQAQQALPPREVPEDQRLIYDMLILLVAIGGVSWLTMARVIRGQVLSLKAQPFMEAARATGVPMLGQFTRHILPNLVGPIVVYATLTVPQAILQESFLSFLGIGVRPPLPSWGNLAAEGLTELNTHRSDWWQLLFPCLLLGVTLLALNFVGEALREALDPKRRAS